MLALFLLGGRCEILCGIVEVDATPENEYWGGSWGIDAAYILIASAYAGGSSWVLNGRPVL